MKLKLEVEACRVGLLTFALRERSPILFGIFPHSLLFIKGNKGRESVTGDF